MFNFKAEYNRNNFVSFLSKDFLPEDFNSKEENLSLDFSSKHATMAVRLGKCPSLDLEVFEITHNSTHDARVGISSDAFQLLLRKSYCNRALVAFIPEGSKNYRFSLLQIEAEQKEQSSRITRNYSNPRRYSYFLGEDAHTKTPEQFLREKGRIKPKDGDYFKDLLDRFSVEVLTKQFYNELFTWYQWALSDTDGFAVTYPNDSSTETDDRKIDEHIIRLITRLMFVWFIKQKKLVPENIFKTSELQNILKSFDPTSKDSGNYYNAILQNLFFATLNKPIAERKFVSEGSYQGKNKHFGIKTLYRDAKEGSWFKQTNDQVIELFNRVPFLNGGLFECLDREDDHGNFFYFDGFSRVAGRQRRAFLPNCLFFDPAKGLIPLLEKYNFTVEENTPTDVEVALDPELLGKVFENLLGAYNPETKETARKQSGSFYTPREIVNYMVDESLFAYLTNACPDIEETTIRQLFTCDTLPEELMHSPEKRNRLIAIIRALKMLDPACGSGAYPMGMLNRMVDLLRKLDMEKSQSNYDLKLYIIENCIYGVDIQTIAVQITKLRFFISLICEQTPTDNAATNFGILPLPNLETKFVAANTLIGLAKKPQQGNLFENPEIEITKNELKEVRHKHFSAKDATQKKEFRLKDAELRQKLAKLLEENADYKPEDAKQLADWNPYDQNTSSPFFDAEWMFGINGGFDIVIGNPPYISGKSGIFSKEEKIYYNSQYAVAEYQLDTYILFTEKGLSLCKNSGILSFIIPNTWLANLKLIRIRKYLLDNTSIKDIVINPSNVFETAVVDTIILITTLKKFRNNEIRIGKFENLLYSLTSNINQDSFYLNDKYIFDVQINSSYRNTLKKIESNCIPIKDICSINRGVHAYRKDGYGKSKFTDGFQTERDYNEKSYHSKIKIDNTYFKEVRGKNIFPYKFEYSNNYVSWGNWLAEPREWTYFSGERIYLRKIIGKTLFASYVLDDNVADQSVYIAKVNHNSFFTKYILALLNSKMLAWYFKIKANEFDDLFPQIKVTEFKQLPIRNVKNIVQTTFINIVDQILSTKQTNPQSDTTALERKIDELVFKLYDLTYAEVLVVCPDFWLSEEEYGAVKVE
jgi:type I restriction-modification system DNA methylase subunit